MVHGICIPMTFGSFFDFFTPTANEKSRFSKNKQKKNPLENINSHLRSKTYDYCMLCCLTINDDGQTDRRWTEKRATDRQMDGQMDQWMNRLTDRRTNKLMKRWKVTHRTRGFYIVVIKHINFHKLCTLNIEWRFCWSKLITDTSLVRKSSLFLYYMIQKC